MLIWICSVFYAEVRHADLSLQCTWSVYAEVRHVDLSLQCTLCWSQACWSESAVYFMLNSGMMICKTKFCFMCVKKRRKKKCMCIILFWCHFWLSLVSDGGGQRMRGWGATMVSSTSVTDMTVHQHFCPIPCDLLLPGHFPLPHQAQLMTSSAIGLAMTM